MKLLIAGDLVVNRPYNASEQIDQNLIDLFSKSDYNIVNLEAPVTDSQDKTLKTGPNLKSNKESTLDILKTLQIDCVTLANNHVRDFGDQGISDTLQFCQENNIATIGAGMNITEASKTLYIDSKEGKIAIVNFAENEWSAATEDSAGFNPMDIIENTYQIQHAKQIADYVIVIIHGGHEYYNLPSPRMQKQYHFYAEQGADIIVGHHTHCISGYEVYKGVPIYYSLGNFLYTSNSSREEWYNGLILNIELNNNELLHKLNFVNQEKVTFKLSLLDTKSSVSDIEQLNKLIKSPEILEEKWNDYINEKSNVFLRLWSPISFLRKNRYLNAIFSHLNISLTNKTGLALYLNLMRCEAHHDLSKNVLKKKLDK